MMRLWALLTPKKTLPMSLKAFHIVFIVLTTTVSLFIGVWGFVQYFAEGEKVSDLAMGTGGVLAALVLLIYGRYVLKKLQHIDYL